MLEITSLNNPKVKNWLKLKDKKYRDLTNLFLIENDHLINEAKKAQVLQETITTNQNIKADYLVTKEIMHQLSNQKSLPELIAVCQKIPPQPIGDKILVLDNIQDPGNLGTIIRSAVAFSCDTIILSTDSVDLYNEKVIRATEGMLFSINIIRTDLDEFFPTIQDKPILITDVTKGENIKKILPLTKYVLVIGNEGQGVKPQYQKYATHYLKINMHPACESLNAGVASSILLYELNEANHE